MLEGQNLVQAVFVVRTMIDAVKTALALRPSQRHSSMIPVYRLVSRQSGLVDQPAIANELVRMRWPR